MPLSGLPGVALHSKQKTKMTTTAKLLIVISRMIRNLNKRSSVERMMPDGAAKDSQLLELDEEYYSDLKELNKLAPEPSFNIVLHDRTNL